MSANNSHVRKSTKVMKRYFDNSKEYKTSRNIDISNKRVKNSTQMLGMSSTSRNASTNAIISNFTASSRIK